MRSLMLAAALAVAASPAIAASAVDVAAYVKRNDFDQIKLSPNGYRTEGHGFYVEAHRKEYYEKLLGFLDRNIGGPTPAASAATAAP